MFHTKIDVATLPKIEENQLTPDQKSNVKELVVVSKEALVHLGLPKTVIDELMKANVFRQHSFTTCGDYNL